MGESETDSETETNSETETDSETGTGTETETDSETGTGTDSETERETETDSADVPFAKPLGVVNLVLAVLLLGGLAVLPARYLPVDGPAIFFALALAASGIGLYGGATWGARVARYVAGATLAAGAVLCTALAFTAAHISGLYGPVGSGGAILLAVVALLLLPYLVLIPAAQLWLLLGRR